MRHLLGKRKMFEKAVMDMSSGGLEFIVVSEPQPLPAPAPGQHSPLVPPGPPQAFNHPHYQPQGTNGLYIIEKRKRTKGRETESGKDEVKTVDLYYIVGFTVCRAPSLYDTLAAQMARCLFCM
jgi:hypothetical protein